MNQIGMKYHTIHACLNDHILCYKQHEFTIECLDCHISRYWLDQITKEVLYKVLQYILIILRLERLFRGTSFTQYMDYHAYNKSKDDIIKILEDGSVFKEIEKICPHFKEKPRNLKLSLVVDDVNPFGDMKSIYSLWPIFSINNNIPPWMYIKWEHIIFSIILLGFFSFNSYLN